MCPPINNNSLFLIKKITIIVPIGKRYIHRIDECVLEMSFWFSPNFWAGPRTACSRKINRESLY